MNQEDISAEIEMYFRQIISLADLMLEHGNNNMPNILTVRDLAQAGLKAACNIDGLIGPIGLGKTL